MSDLERRLADALDGASERHLDEAPHSPGSVQRLVVQRVRRRWGFVVVGTTASIILLVALAAVSVPRLISDREGTSNDVAALVPVTTTIEIGKHPVAIAADDEAVWVALENGFLQRIDASSNADVTGMRIASALTDVAVGGDQVWASGTPQPGETRRGLFTDENVFYRIDPSQMDYDLITFEGAHLSLAVTPPSVWSISEDANPEGGTLNRFTFDPRGGSQIGFGGVESTEWIPDGLVADGDSIWTIGTDTGYVVRQLDGVTGEVRQEVMLGKPLADRIEPWMRPDITSPVAVGDGSVVATWWTRNKLAQIDQHTGSVLNSDFGGAALTGEFGGPRAVAISQGEAWVVTANDRVARFDLESGELIGEPIEVGSDPVDIAAGAGAVWTINRGDGTVTRIDLAEPAPGPAPEQTPIDGVPPETPTPPPSPTPSQTADSDDPAEALDVDAQMTELIEDAGAPCNNFDVQSKEEVEGNLYRPAYCDDRSETTVLLFSFATMEDREAWADAGRPSEFSIGKRPSIVVGLTWEAHVIGADLARRLGEKLDGEVIQWTED
ncbi:MAG: hypothetical protein ACRDJ2_15065 [Actinomycetota bacterium]